MFRRDKVRVVDGDDSLAYQSTRGAFSFLTGISRGFCKHCKTPSVV
jgi:hypothetical protein